MILQWADSDFQRMERMLGVIYDAGMIYRSDLLMLLGWNPRMMNRYLKACKTRADDMIRKTYMIRKHASQPNKFIRNVAYTLGQDGVKYVHQMLGINGKIVTMEAQSNHALGLNEILFRYLKGLRKGSPVKALWFSTREAADELFRLRQSAGESEVNIKSTLIRPDAMFVVPSGLHWVEYDNNTEGSRQLLKKYRLYITNLERLHESFCHVVWVTKTEQRKQSMERIWNEIKNDHVRMTFYVEGSEHAAWGA